MGPGLAAAPGRRWFERLRKCQPMTNAELTELVARIARRDTAAFADFYRALEKPLYRFIISKLNDPFLAADLLHDVFLEVWRAASGFQDRSSVKTWVFAIAYRKVMDVFRKEGRLTGEDELPERADDSPGAVQSLIAEQEKEMVRHCLAALKPDHRTAIELTFFEDMSYREVAAVIGVPEGTVKTRVFHAKSLLLRCLEARLKKGLRR
jgi:RNA polymerase sigma-70 factor (ECF subfamily)